MKTLTTSNTQIGSIEYPEVVDSVIDRIIYYSNAYSKTWDEDIYTGLLKSINTYLEALSPIPYIPGLVDKLSDMVVIPLWESKINTEILGKLLRGIIEVKYGICRDNCIPEINELSDHLENALRELSGGEIGLRDVCSGVVDRVQCYVSVTALILVLSTNP